MGQSCGLPPRYLEVGNLDMFVNESTGYSSPSMQANIQVEAHVYPSLPTPCVRHNCATVCANKEGLDETNACGLHLPAK